jgi:glycine/D-amino acid oxidase-like deaminating enzyme
MKHTIIIGGGGIGSAIAYFLSAMPEAGRITVIERDPTYRSASSSLSASSIRQQFSTPINVQLSQFGYAFMRSMASVAAHSPVGLESRGYLFLGRGDQATSLRERTRVVRSLGGAVEEFDQAELTRRYPWIQSDDIVYASQGTDGEGWFDGYMLQQWYGSRARSAGVTYVHGNVSALLTHGSKVAAVELTNGERLVADQVVNAAGAWSAALAEMVDVALPVRARRRTVFVVSCPSPPPSFPILIDSTGVFVRPEQKHFLCVLSPEALRDHDDLPLDPDFTLFDERIWPALAERVPAFESLRIERAWAGYYEFNTVDHNGLVGQVGPENFYVATGFSGHGLMHSAGVGRGVAELLLHGEYRTLDLAPLSPARLSAGRLIVEDAIY